MTRGFALKCRRYPSISSELWLSALLMRLQVHYIALCNIYKVDRASAYLVSQISKTAGRPYFLPFRGGHLAGWSILQPKGRGLVPLPLYQATSPGPVLHHPASRLGISKCALRIEIGKGRKSLVMALR